MDFTFLVSLIQQSPKISIIVIACLITFVISLINYLVLNKERMHEIKARQKELQAQMKEHQKAGNTAKMMEAQKEMFSYMGETFKHSMKPMLITMIPILVVFGLIRNTFTGTSIAGSWFWYYLITAIASSMIFRKLFKLP